MATCGRGRPRRDDLVYRRRLDLDCLASPLASLANPSTPLLAVDDLHVAFKTDDGLVRAVRGVSFDVHRGETLAIVGESGSGKSVTNLAVMGLVPRPPGVIERGSAIFDGRDLLQIKPEALRKIRGRHVAMIFQDPMTSLNPLMTVGSQLTEMTRLHLSLNRHEADRKAVQSLAAVGIASPEQRLREYPHQYSGGMRQRVMIAMALSCDPELLIADEPTTALDATIQAQIMDLLGDLQSSRGTAIILITHDLGVVAGSADRVAVMYAGRIVEQTDVRTLFANPAHPYTAGLLASLPRIDSDGTEPLRAIPGQPPDMTEDLQGCSYRPRCPHAFERCVTDDPILTQREKPSHLAACHLDSPPVG